MLFSKLKSNIYKIFNKINQFSLPDYCNAQVEKYGMQYREFSIFIILNHTFPNFMWSNGLIEVYTILGVKFFAGLLCTGLLMKEFWPTKLNRYFALYWYFTLLFCLPFTNSIMVLDHSFANGWLVITLLSIFLLSSLVNWKDYLIMLILGVSFAIICFDRLGGNLNLGGLQAEAKFWSVYAVIFTSLIGIVFNRNKELLERERDESAKSIAGMIAHEVRNPMFALGGGIYGIRKAVNNQDSERALSLIDFLDRIMQETNFTIQMILTKLRGIDENDNTYADISIKDCIEEAINEYYFTENEKEKVSYICTDDFLFKGNKILMKHIIFNLLKNSLTHISNKSAATITLETLSIDNSNLLLFKDTGSGIRKERLETLFRSFSTTSDTGTGLGLYFCSKVMKSFEGRISCTSVEHEHTTFTLSFKPLD